MLCLHKEILLPFQYLIFTPYTIAWWALLTLQDLTIFLSNDYQELRRCLVEENGGGTRTLSNKFSCQVKENGEDTRTLLNKVCLRLQREDTRTILNKVCLRLQNLNGCRDFDITEIDTTESDVTETDITESDITESDITESDIT